MRRRAFLMGALAAAPALPVLAQPKKPESREMIGLPQVHEAARAAVDAKTVPGVMVLLARGGKVAHREALGVAGGAGGGVPLAPDTVIWLASMSKPIAAAAILLLVEDGKVKLDDPVSRYVPEFAAPAKVRVLKPGQEPPKPPVPGQPPAPPPEYDIVPAARALTVRDLLTHTGGLQTIGVANPALPPLTAGATLATWVPQLAAVPLEFQPGSKWAYSNAASFDVVSRIVEVGSGQTYNAFLKARLLGPLGMADTGFGRRAAAAARTVPMDPRFAADPRIVGDTYFSGAAGMWGSMDDYAKFAGMLADGGMWNGKRILKASSVAEMTRNQVGDLMPGVNGRPRSPGLGFGLGVMLVRDAKAAGLAVPDGTFGWDGAGGTRFWVTPGERRVLVMYAPAAAVQIAIEKAVAEGLGG